MSINGYVAAIIRELTAIEVPYGDQSTLMSASNVSAQNQHRPLLESIRNDLYHFDEEKRARIVYTIENYVAANPQEDAKLLEVLDRILQVVRQFKATKQVLISPVKNTGLAPRRVSPTELNEIARKLDFFIDSYLSSDEKKSEED
jgi:hypothetical protein